MMMAGRIRRSWFIDEGKSKPADKKKKGMNTMSGWMKEVNSVYQANISRDL